MTKFIPQLVSCIENMPRGGSNRVLSAVIQRSR